MKKKKTAKKPKTKKPKITVSKKKSKLAHDGTNGTNGTNGTDRQYPEIDHFVEVAVLSYARGESLGKIAEKLNKSKSGVWHWFQDPIVAACLEKEREKVYLEAKALTPKLVDLTYNALVSKAEKGELTFREGVQFLEKTGYLHTTQDKAEQNRRIAQLADQLYAELLELESEK